MEPATIELIKGVTTDAIKILGPAAIAAYVAYRAFKGQFELEKLRLHDKDKTEAYKRLFVFARKLQNETFPLAEQKQSAFSKLMHKEYFEKVELDSIYFPAEITKILDELEERYVCMNRGELVPEMDKNEEREFIEKKLFEHAIALTKHVRKAMQEMAVSA